MVEDDWNEEQIVENVDGMEDEFEGMIVVVKFVLVVAVVAVVVDLIEGWFEANEVEVEVEGCGLEVDVGVDDEVDARNQWNCSSLKIIFRLRISYY